jgi:hypothetical protein
LPRLVSHLAPRAHNEQKLVVAGGGATAIGEYLVAIGGPASG